MSRVIVHNRQFVAGPEPFRLDEGWVCRQLNTSTWVSHCPNLRTKLTSDADDARWLLMGLTAETVDHAPEPEVAVARARSDDVPDLYQSWAGRWALIGRDLVHMDASGLLGCFYGRDPKNRTWASSSPALLARLLSPGGGLEVDPRELRYETGIPWFPPPRSRLGGMQRLLPSQTLDLKGGRVASRPLMPPIDPSRAYEEMTEALMESLVTAVRRLPTDGNPLWISLSAGGDSRLVLAAAHVASLRSGPQLRAFTRVTNRMSLADYLLPPKLAREVGCQHEFLRSRRYMPERLRLVSEHAVGHVSEGDALPFLTGERDALRGITLGGQGFGMAKVESRDKIPSTHRDAAEGAAQLAHAEPIDSTATAGLRDWLEWVRETPHPHLDWRDRYYLEQRMAGWQSSKEQIYDMDQHERFFPINAARSYALLLSIDENRRRGMRHHIDMISRSVPPLMNHPINPPNEGFGRWDWIRVRYQQDWLYLLRRRIERLRGRRR